MKKRVVHGSCLLLLVTSLFVLADEKATPVSVVATTVAAVYDEVPLSGSVTARRVSRISPKIEGFVAELLVDEGDEIKSGDALLYLDPVMAKIGLARVQAQLQEAEASLSEAKRQRDEAAELLKKKHTSATNHEARVADVAIKTAVLNRLKAELSQQQETLSRHTVYAPFDGVIASKEIEVGEWVDTGTSLLELVEISILRINVQVPQIYFGQIRKGTAAILKFDAFPERSFDASVTMKIPAGNASTRTFPLRMEIKNEEGIIAPGMSARVRIKLQREAEAMLLPRDAIVRKPDGSELVWLVVKSGASTIARSIQVKTGRAYRDSVEVFSSELLPGTKVVIRGNEILRADQNVKIVSEIKLKL
jgi:RND family efflux transporter MFP subunit